MRYVRHHDGSEWTLTHTDLGYVLRKDGDIIGVHGSPSDAAKAVTGEAASSPRSFWGMPPSPPTGAVTVIRPENPNMPGIGESVMTEYDGEMAVATRLEDGYLLSWRGEETTHPTLSSAAGRVAGSYRNGASFFRLGSVPPIDAWELATAIARAAGMTPRDVALLDLEVDRADAQRFADECMKYIAKKSDVMPVACDDGVTRIHVTRRAAVARPKRNSE